MPIHPPSQPDE